jgi:hypothetical protein
MTIAMPLTRPRAVVPTLVTVLIAMLVLPLAAHAATVSVAGDVLRVAAAAGEGNQLTVAAAPAAPDPRAGSFTVTDWGAPLTAGPGCTLSEDGSATCAAPSAAPPLARIEVDAGDLDDSVSVAAPLPVAILGADGDDALRAASPSSVLDGGVGDDAVEGGDGPDQLLGGDGDDRLTGGYGDDAILGGTGADFADGGDGHDAIEVRDRLSDSAWCGAGRDSVSAETLDALDVACERVDYGPAGQVGRLAPMIGGGRWVPIPGQTWARVDRRILANVLYLVRRYRVRVTEGYASSGHARLGEHPLGLAVDIEPGPGGTWADVARLARWAEPRQNDPRSPFRWVGWNGDYNHGHPARCKPSRGCSPHLHLSWAHSPGKPRRPVRTVWVFQVR